MPNLLLFAPNQNTTEMIAVKSTSNFDLGFQKHRPVYFVLLGYRVRTCDLLQRPNLGSDTHPHHIPPLALPFDTLSLLPSTMFAKTAATALSAAARSVFAGAGVRALSSTAGQPITCRAAVAWKAAEPLVIEEVEVAPPKVSKR